MPIYKIADKFPQIGNGTWIAPSAEIIGDVKIGENCYIGFGAVIRGDFGSIRIGSETMIEECVVIHTRIHTEIGHQVIIGHMAMIHDAVIKDGALIGMKSIVSEYASIGEGAIVAEQSLIKKHSSVAPGKIVAGSPAKVIGNVTKRHKNRLSLGHQAYVDLIKKYFLGFKRVD